MIEPETAVILSQTSASPYKGGLVNLNPEELEEPPSNEGPFFEVVDLSSASTASTIDFSTPITQKFLKEMQQRKIKLLMRTGT